MNGAINVVGGGLAGVEAAWQAAEMGAEVRLYEMRPVQQTPAHRTITVGLETIPAQHFQNFPMEMAGSLVSALPAVLVYLLFQRYLIRGLTMGMSK